jgi:ribosome-binding protein aMBF1 (putative translation factor)
MEQDWTTVTMGKSDKKSEKKSVLVSNGPHVLTKAIPVETKEKKEKEEKPLPTVTVEIKIAIQQARMNAKMSQKDLAAKMCVPVGVIHSYENGTAIPNNAFLARIEKLLNTKIPRLKKHTPNH